MLQIMRLQRAGRDQVTELNNAQNKYKGLQNKSTFVVILVSFLLANRVFQLQR